MLRFIRRGRELGFAMPQISELLSLWRDKSRQSAEVKRIAAAHMNELREKIDGLEQMANTLQTLIECCAGDNRPDCPILTDLENAAGPGPKTRSEEHTSELQSRGHLVCRLLLEKKIQSNNNTK